MIEVLWKKGWRGWWKGQSGWEVTTQGKTQTFLFSDKSLDEMPRNLRAKNSNKPFSRDVILASFKKLFSPNETSDAAVTSDFFKWWHSECAAQGDKVFLLRFDNGGWDLPWELLIGELIEKYRPSVSIARSSGTLSKLAPQRFENPLRTLILLGDDGHSIGKPINLDKEVENIKTAWNSLEKTVQDLIAEPLVKPAERATLTELLSDYKPDVIWFSGHGAMKPKVSLYFADKQWINSADFGKLISESASRPLYAVFWACNTARDNAEMPDAFVCPPLFAHLRDAGILSVLAMQSPIKNMNAVAMAGDLFRYLAAGLPLEKATARARANLLAEPQENITLDWASLVVWCAGQMVEKLEWNAPASSLIQHQLLGRQSLRALVTEYETLNPPVTSDEELWAKTWISSKQVWITGEFVETHEGSKLNREHLDYWARTLRAIQATNERFVIAVELSGENLENELQQWAEKVRSSLLWEDSAEELAGILGNIARGVVSGWRKLCEMPDIFLSISIKLQQSPDELKPDWFWQPLTINSEALNIAVISNVPLPEKLNGIWSVDRIGREMEAGTIEEAYSKAPRLANALAVLNMPLGDSRVEILSEDFGGVKRLAEWNEGRKLRANSPVGYVLSASARAFILNRIDSEELKQAHLDCINMLSNSDLRLNLQIREHRLHHLLGAEMFGDALEEAAILCYQYEKEGRPSSVLATVKRIGSRYLEIPRFARLSIAWAHLRTGKLAQAEFWLNKSYPATYLDKAWKHAMQAEVYKSKGNRHSKNDALAEIETAISQCRLALNDAQENSALVRQKLRAYQQDRARIIQFLFPNAKQQAVEIYEQLLKEWDGNEEANLDLAAVKRNFAELLTSQTKNSSEPLFRRGWDLLNDAYELAKTSSDAPIIAEILYEKSKILERQDKQSDSLRCLEQCQQSARRSRYDMMWIIAENRLFWKHDKNSSFENFSYHRWNDIEEQLRGFPQHGWAVRTLIQGRLRAARRLEKLSDLSTSYEELVANLNDIRQNPSFDQGSDRFRIAATAAGLDVISNKLGKNDGHWTKFIEKYEWSTELLDEQHKSTPETIWNEVG